MTVAGLTFQTAADARAFDKGVKLAVEDIHAGEIFTHIHFKSILHPLLPKYVDKCRPFAMSIFLHEINQDGETVIDVIGIAL